MKIVNLHEVNEEIKNNCLFKLIFDKKNTSNDKVTMGMVTIPPGARIPAAGEGVHSSDEYSFICKGSVVTMVNGREIRISSGQAAYIPAGESHWTINDGTEDCEVLWVLVKN